MSETTPLTVEKLKEPLKQDEREEMDNPCFLEQLHMFIEAVNKLPGLSKERQGIWAAQLREHVKMRASVKRAVIDNPEVLKVPVEPVFIVGLHRCGTTMLHRLLSCNPRFLAAAQWELLQPCPPGRPKNWKESQRYKNAAKYLGYMYPGDLNAVEHMHHFDIDLPDECYCTLQAAFLDNAWGVHPNFERLRTYNYNLPKDKQLKVFEHYKNALQCIFYECLTNGQTVLLKNPWHNLHIDTVIELFPNAKFIFPYRNAREFIGSSCSLFNMTEPILGFDLSKKDIKDYVLQLNKVASARMINAINKLPKERKFVIPYSAVIKDPISAVKSIFSHFGWEFASEGLQNMRRHLEENKQNKHGKHSYDISQWGVTQDDLKEALPEYLEYFGTKENML